jgi:hypothetical protein
MCTFRCPLWMLPNSMECEQVVASRPRTVVAIRRDGEKRVHVMHVMQGLDLPSPH